MAKKKTSKSVTTNQFKRIERTFRKHYDIGLEFDNNAGVALPKMCSSDCAPEFCKIVNKTAKGAARCRQNRLRSLKTAFETGQPYTCLCHAGIVLVCVPIMEKDIPLGGVFFGKCLWEQADKTITDDMIERLIGLRYSKQKLISAAEDLPVIAARRIHDATEFLFVLVYEILDIDPWLIRWRKERTQQQSEISTVIQKSKGIDLVQKYPYKMEQELIGKVKIGDRTGARKILNTLLGTIMFNHPGQVNILKARLVELLGVLSRAAVEGGVDVDLMLEKNMVYLNKVINVDKQEDICVWISSALNDFIESVYVSNKSQKVHKLKPVIEFMESNFDQPLTLTDLAKVAHLSVSRFAHLFKEQMDITPIDYLTKVRIECAKDQLLTTDDSCTKVSFDNGYNNQSYFNRIFKEQVGMTPLQFRKLNQR